MKAINLTPTKLITRVALIGCALLLSACGSSVKPRGQASANGTTPDYIDPTIPTTNNPTGTQCNSFDSKSARLSGRVTTYYSKGQMVADKIRLRITGLDTSFSSTSNMHVKFFRWKADDAGTVELDQNPLNFTVEKGTSQSSSISSSMTSFNSSTMTSLRTSASVPGTTQDEFFANTLFVLSGVDYAWDSLKVVLYDGATVVGQADLLLPIFTSDPNDYATNHPNVLNQLHPFWSERSQNLADAQWLARANSYCF